MRQNRNRNYGDAELKNHVADAAPGVLAAMGQLFGISQGDFLEAVFGEPGAIKKIADMGRLSQTARDNLEKALEATKLTIETTGDINKALADLAKQTHRSGNQVMSAIYDATLTERKMYNELTEMEQKQSYAISAEASRHLQTHQLINIQGTTAQLMALAKYEVDLQREQNKPLDAQDTAERAYDRAVNALLWQQGSEAPIDRIPVPDYSGVSGYQSRGSWANNAASRVSSLWHNFRRAMGI